MTRRGTDIFGSVRRNEEGEARNNVKAGGQDGRPLPTLNDVACPFGMRQSDVESTAKKYEEKSTR
jgi:hypothetical protein